MSLQIMMHLSCTFKFLYSCFYFCISKNWDFLVEGYECLNLWFVFKGYFHDGYSSHCCASKACSPISSPALDMSFQCYKYKMRSHLCCFLNFLATKMIDYIFMWLRLIDTYFSITCFFIFFALFVIALFSFWKKPISTRLSSLLNMTFQSTKCVHKHKGVRSMSVQIIAVSVHWHLPPTRVGNKRISRRWWCGRPWHFCQWHSH